jgi:hypothetical protein
MALLEARGLISPVANTDDRPHYVMPHRMEIEDAVVGLDRPYRL